MTRVIIYFIITIASTVMAFAQTGYEKGMGKALGLMQEGKWAEAENLFVRIAAAEDDQWLPHYYIAQINTFGAFGTKDEQQLKLMLEKAAIHATKAMERSPDNAEILIQQAMINTAWINFDGQTYAMTLSPKNAALYAKALAIAPENPRVVLSKAEWDMGSARFFGQDTSPYCKDVAHALELFSTFKSASEFHPNWGRKRAEELAANCN